MLLATKLHIPHVRSALMDRPNLMQNLNDGKRAKLTIITAPAGYGKTTALSQWVKQYNMLTAWISLDKQDNSFTQFWNYVLAAITNAHPDLEIGNWPKKDSFHESFYSPMITALINGLNSLPDELVLILDDFHVIQQPSIHTSLSYLLEVLPPHIHLYIASRSTPFLPTARLQARGELHTINIDDLRFEQDEASIYFENCMDLTLSKEDVYRLTLQTEGWISGLHLAALSLKRSRNPLDLIRQFNGQQRDIASYLLEEVFLHQSEEVRTFLMKTSILKRMNSSLCEAVTGVAQSEETMEMLEQQNLFIVPLDEQRDWYRYHHLFADFLQRYLQQKHPKEWMIAHENAARWLELHGFIEEAVDHFIAGSYNVEAVGLIEKLLPTMVQANWAVLHRWITVLPEACISEKPMIEIYYISVLIGFGELELAKMRAEQVEKRLAGMKHTLTDEDWGKAIGNLYWGYAMIAYTQRDFQRAIDCLDVIEQHMPEGSYLQTLGGNAAVGSKYDDMIAHINDLHLAESFIKRWVKTWENKKNYRFGGYFYVAYSELLYEWNRLEEAELYAERVLQQKDMQQLSRNLVRAVTVASRIQYITGCPDMAHEMLEQVKSKINSPDYLIFSMRIEALKANLWILQGSNDDLAHWLQTCGFSYKDDIPLYHIGEYMTLARTLAHCGHLVECEYLLERLHRLVSREDRLRDRIRVLIGQCIMLYLGGREQNALVKLEEALYLAEPYGYIRSFIDEGESMANMLTRYLNLRQLKHIRSSFPVSLAYVGKLLLLMNVSVKGNVTRTSLLTEQETKILRLIEQDMSNKQIAEHTHVTVGTVKTHIKNMYKKLDVNSRLKALQRAKELNLI